MTLSPLQTIRQYVSRLTEQSCSTHFTMQIDERAPSPEAVLLKSSQENLGPSEDDDAEFAKELAKMVIETSAESRKVDKKTALALWESTVPPPGMRKKRQDDHDEEADAAAQGGQAGPGVMNFTLYTKRGNKPMVCSIRFLRS